MDAVALLYRLMDAKERCDQGHDETARRWPSNSGQNHRKRYAAPTAKFADYFQSSVGEQDPEAIDRQLGFAHAQVQAQDESLEPWLLSVIAECSKDLERLGKQALQASYELIECYKALGTDDNVDGAVSKAKDCFWEVFGLETDRSEAFLNIAFLVGKALVRNGNATEAEKLFPAIQSAASEEIGPDQDATIHLLLRIGSLYQNENRWEDAESRFEQALAASMTRHGIKAKLTERLVKALEQQRYTATEVSSIDFDGSCEAGDRRTLKFI
jgi:tetratricopeptide (TPR) repeat protein